ncbi:MAG: hypothetical protein ACKO7P_09610 [Bacteroidota bacterium]
MKNKKVLIAALRGSLALIIGIFLLFKSYGVELKIYTGNYKSWDFTHNNIIGVYKLGSTKGREYVKITAVNDSITKVEEFNTQNVLQQTITIFKKAGKIATIDYKNLHGFVYRKRKFEHAEGEMLETSKKEGVNEFLPCKGIKHKYKDDINYESIYIGMDNKPTTGPSGFCIARYSRFNDEKRWGLAKQISFHDVNGKPVESEFAYHKVAFSRDTLGNVLEEWYYNKANVLTKIPLKVCGLKYKYNNLDQKIMEEYFDSIKAKTQNVYGISMEKYEYQNSNLTKLTRYGLNNEIISGTENKSMDGASIIKHTYDKRGNILTTSYFDKNEKPMNNTNKYFIVENTYDKYDNKVSLGYKSMYNFNVDVFGKNKYVYTYDDRGLKLSEAYFNSNGIPIKDRTDEVFMIKYKYDKEGKQISQSYWQNDSTKMSRLSGAHEYVTKYNDQGQMLELISMDDKGKIKTESFGASKKVYEYDKLSRLSKRKMFNDNGPATMGSAEVSSFHAIHYEYDHQNKVSTISYFDIKGNPTNATVSRYDGDTYVHKVEFIYEGNKVVSQKWYSTTNVVVKVINCILQPGMGNFGNGIFWLNTRY